MRFRSTYLWSFCIAITSFLSFSISSSASTIDSVGVERVGDQSYILHEVEPKETLFGISRRYQAPVGDIVNANASLKQGLKIGQTIRVPFIPKSELPAGAILHKVVPGETLFSISKKYGVSVNEIMASNELKGNDLSVGQPLVIQKPVVAETKPTPVSTPSVTNTATPKAETPAPVKEAKAKPEPKPKPENPKPVAPKPEASRPSTVAATKSTTPIVPGDWMSHTVKSDETLFSIASQYGARVEDLITWNALTSNNLAPGQVLKVGRGAPEESKVPVVGTPKVVSSVEEMNIEPTAENTSGGFKNVKETGQAELIEGTGGHKKYLVLHRTAPIGTIMRVKNEENDVTIFARVVGVLPETGDNSKLVIKLSQAAFDQLKAVNGRFPVEVMY
ncbi:MAG: LysM peptidoglycan-binding domain-containing protein [Algoriphagus sp.]|uniref:LysM peptidoglycan-binding domain-containing protein n=1 Tax=Algoriphagus sp. TaxID=1872435 RepID=UPI002633F7E4|nr:LysM peptidoglycan-binding domain-containing protein [Algoriphagus sp.]MDG1276753.1 LysM peptidoglycan-binding domain-containing protein [Algoriphagus sp.]